MVVKSVLQAGFMRKRSRTYSNSTIRLRILRTTMRAASLHPGDTVDVELLQFSPSSSFFLSSSSTRCKESHAGILTLPFLLRDVHRGRCNEAPPRLQLSPTNATIGGRIRSPFTGWLRGTTERARVHFRFATGRSAPCRR